MLNIVLRQGGRPISRYPDPLSSEYGSSVPRGPDKKGGTLFIIVIRSLDQIVSDLVQWFRVQWELATGKTDFGTDPIYDNYEWFSNSLDIFLP